MAAIAIQHVTVLLVTVELQAVSAVGLGQRGKQALCEKQEEQKNAADDTASAREMQGEARGRGHSRFEKSRVRTLPVKKFLFGHCWVIAGQRASVTKGQRTRDRWHATRETDARGGTARLRDRSRTIDRPLRSLVSDIPANHVKGGGGRRCRRRGCRCPGQQGIKANGLNERARRRKRGFCEL